MIAIDTIVVENEIADNMYQRSELDYLIYNAPLEYADLIEHIAEFFPHIDFIFHNSNSFSGRINAKDKVIERSVTKFTD